MICAEVHDWNVGKSGRDEFVAIEVIVCLFTTTVVGRGKASFSHKFSYDTDHQAQVIWVPLEMLLKCNLFQRSFNDLRFFFHFTCNFFEKASRP